MENNHQIELEEEVCQVQWLVVCQEKAKSVCVKSGWWTCLNIIWGDEGDILVKIEYEGKGTWLS